MFWYFYFLILVRLPTFVYILFCFGFWFWNGSTGCLQRTVEEKSLSSVRQCRWRRAWLLNSALRRVWCLALTGFLKWAYILSLNWTWRLQAMSFYSSTLISLLFLSLTLYVWPWSSHLTLEGINLFIIWRKKKNLLFSILIFLSSPAMILAANIMLTPWFIPQNYLAFVCVCGKFIKFKQEKNLAIIPPHIILPKILLATASHLRNKTGRIWECSVHACVFGTKEMTASGETSKTGSLPLD